jgi:[NiFe] hydrogenase assembly HybE family chaperone
MSSSEPSVQTSEPPQQPEAVERLIAAYRRVDGTMRDLPVYNPALQVAAVDFRPFEGGLVGVVVTPWFMNLIRLPAPGLEVAAGARREAALPADRVDLIGARLDGAPPFEFRPIVSPMDDFPSQAQALLTAGEVVEALFTPRKAAPPAAPVQKVPLDVVAPLGAPPPKPAAPPAQAATASPAPAPKPAFLAEEERAARAEPEDGPEPLGRTTGRRGLFNVFRR